jgi:hypothetical protein
MNVPSRGYLVANADWPQYSEICNLLAAFIVNTRLQVEISGQPDGQV